MEVKLLKVKQKVGNKTYIVYRITLPRKIVEALGLNDGKLKLSIIEGEKKGILIYRE